jgi:cytochrome b subunit of formate dehydrogenase
LKELKRFSPAQRAAHILASVSGILLLITGLPITFSTQLGWIIDLMGESISMLIHRICGLILTFTLAYFGTYFLLERLTRGRADSNLTFTPRFLIGLQKDMIQDMLWTFGLVKERPKSGKYDWVMVADIMSVPTFCLLMVITGAFLWFPFPLLGFNPALFFIFRTIHAGIAIIAVFFVFAHATILHFTPGNFPINMGIFRGLIPKHKAEGEFPLWVPIAEEVETDAKPYKFHPIGYIVGILAFSVMFLTAYVMYLTMREGLAAFRLLQESPIAFIALNGTIAILFIYLFMSFYGLSRGFARS